VTLGVLFFEVESNGIHVGLCAFNSRRSFQPPINVQIVKLTIELIGPESQGHPEVYSSRQEAELGWRHPDDNVILIIEPNAFSYDVAIALESTLPQSMAQDNDPVSSWIFFFRHESATDERIDTQDLEQAGRAEYAQHLLWLTLIRKIEHRAIHGHEGVEDLILIPPTDELCGGD